jgi:mycothiol synthase
MSSSLLQTRRATSDDIPAVGELLAAYETAIVGRDLGTVADLPSWWAHADLETGSWLVEGDGSLDAAAWVAQRAWWEASVVVRPGREKLLEPLLELCEEHVRNAGGDFVRVPMFALDRTGCAALERRDYRPVRRFFEMRIALDGRLAEPSWPEGIRVADFRRADARAYFDAIGEAFADEWGFRTMAFEDWFRLRVDEADTSFYFVAWAGDEVAGFVRGEDRGDAGWIGMIGVRPAWRRRGIAEALLRHSFVEFRRRGKTSVGLGVDAENATGATRLYRRIGMEIEAEDVSYERSLG